MDQWYTKDVSEDLRWKQIGKRLGGLGPLGSDPTGQLWKSKDHSLTVIGVDVDSCRCKKEEKN